MSDKRVDILTTETLEGDTLTLHGITQAQTDQIITNQNDITQLNTDLTNEIERAESKETELNSLISSETSRAESKESELNSLISSETSRAESKESELTSLISSETSRAETKESELTSLISSETSRAETKESELTSLISSETSRAETKESELTSLISSETTRAETKETNLQTEIDELKETVKPATIDYLKINQLNDDCFVGVINHYGGIISDLATPIYSVSLVGLEYTNTYYAHTDGTTLYTINATLEYNLNDYSKDAIYQLCNYNLVPGYQSPQQLINPITCGTSKGSLTSFSIVTNRTKDDFLNLVTYTLRFNATFPTELDSDELNVLKNGGYNITIPLMAIRRDS